MNLREDPIVAELVALHEADRRKREKARERLLKPLGEKAGDELARRITSDHPYPGSIGDLPIETDGAEAFVTVAGYRLSVSVREEDSDDGDGRAGDFDPEQGLFVYDPEHNHESAFVKTPLELGTFLARESERRSLREAA